MKRQLLWILPPLILLSALIVIVWRNDHVFPVTTPMDLSIRARLENSNSGASVFRESPTLIKSLATLSPANRTDLLDHLWLHQNSISGDMTKPKLVIHFALKKGQAEFYFGDNTTEDSLYIANWANEPGFGGSPPITISEEYYALDRTSSRYFRRWLARRGVLNKY